MKYQLSKGAHSVYALQYHFVQCVKYRRDALVEPWLSENDYPVLKKVDGVLNWEWVMWQLRQL
jgi:REP element-mobilizing transposase RayT